MVFWIILPTAVLIALSAFDLIKRRLPNYGLLLLMAWLVLNALWLGLPLSRLGVHALTGFAVFVVLFLLFMAGAMGGGDVKLGAVLFLWAGPAHALAVLVIVAWAGVLVACTGWLADRLARLTCLQHGLSGRILYALSARRGVPYGVALACGGLYLVYLQTLGAY